MLIITELSAKVEGKLVLQDISLEVSAGEVNVIMGPNGSGKSTLANVLIGRPGYELVSGSIELDGVSLVDLSPSERARLGLFATQQYPIQIPGVTLFELLEASPTQDQDIQRLMEQEAAAIGMEKTLLERSGINVDLSGGESKLSEAIQLAILKPPFAILDELDSGLDLDAVAAVGRCLQKLVEKHNLGVLAITHYPRLLDEMPAQHIHILVDGKIVESGGQELALEIEAEGYARFETPTEAAVDIRLD